MSNLVKAVQITGKLYEIRDTVKNLYGARWLEVLKPHMEVLEGIHKEKGVPYLELGRMIAKGMQADGLNPMMVLAAMVELIEPSAEVAHA